MFWRNIHSLIGTSGESKLQSLTAGLDVYSGTNVVLPQVISGLPLVVTDGLLVRCTLRSFDFYSLFIDMAVLQNMEQLASNHCTFIDSLCGRDW